MSKYLERARLELGLMFPTFYQRALEAPAGRLAALLEEVERETREAVKVEQGRRLPSAMNEGARGVPASSPRRDGAGQPADPAAPTSCSCQSLAAALRHVIARHPMLMRIDYDDPWYLNGADAALRDYEASLSRPTEER